LQWRIAQLFYAKVIFQPANITERKVDTCGANKERRFAIAELKQRRFQTAAP
jgi:hypothetical protein